MQTEELRTIAYCNRVEISTGVVLVVCALNIVEFLRLFQVYVSVIHPENLKIYF
jgi:hypothetical protein